MKRIRHVSDLPDWFRLEKYEDANKLDAAGWYEQLNVRIYSFMIVGLPVRDGQSSVHGIELDASVLAALKAVRDAPIVDVDRSDILTKHFFPAAFTGKNSRPNKPHYSLGVHSLTVLELRGLDSRITPGRREYSRRYWDELLNNDKINEKRVYKRKSWMNAPTYESNRLIVKDASKTDPKRDHPVYGKPPMRLRGASESVNVNLSLPDTVLVNAFKQWLAKARQENHIGTTTMKRYRKPDFESWVRFGILPWLDLTIWEAEANVTIPNRVMADAILLPSEGNEENVRKTTKPLALSLIRDQKSNGHPLSSLAAQAAHEHFETV